MRLSLQLDESQEQARQLLARLEETKAELLEALTAPTEAAPTEDAPPTESAPENTGGS